MNCEEAELFLDAYVDGELDLISEVDLEKHMVACRECTREIKALRDLRDSFADLAQMRAMKTPKAARRLAQPLF